MITWHSFDFVTGNRGIEVPTRQRGSVSRVIGEATTSTLELVVWDEEAKTPVPGWETATEPGRSMLVALDEDERVVWGGLVLTRTDNSGKVTVDLATCEAYLERRYTGTLLFPETAQTEIAVQLLAAAGETNVDVVASTRTRQRAYHDSEDIRIAAALSELTEVDGGIEYTCDLVWANTERTKLKRVWRIADQLGRPSDATFEKPGAITSYTFLESYTSDKGANMVLATSSGEGSARPTSQLHQDVPAGWARFEHRYSAASNITRLVQLDQHAAQTLSEMREGMKELTFEAHLDAGPRVGVDFHLGDEVTVKITSERFPEQRDGDGAVVPGLVTAARVIGYTADYDGHRLIPVTRSV